MAALAANREHASAYFSKVPGANDYLCETEELEIIFLLNLGTFFVLIVTISIWKSLNYYPIPSLLSFHRYQRFNSSHKIRLRFGRAVTLQNCWASSNLKPTGSSFKHCLLMLMFWFNLPLCLLNVEVYMWKMINKDGMPFQFTSICTNRGQYTPHQLTLQLSLFPRTFWVVCFPHT